MGGSFDRITDLAAERRRRPSRRLVLCVCVCVLSRAVIVHSTTYARLWRGGRRVDHRRLVAESPLRRRMRRDARFRPNR